jgi:hypothetical protein
MVVLARAVMDLAARVAALDLDRGVADGKPPAQTLLQVTDEVLGIAERTVTDHDVHAEGRVFGGKGPHVKVMEADDLG